jgi:hypothetical protein
MASTVILKRDGKQIGELAIFDAAPSFHLLSLVFPEPAAIIHDQTTGEWIVVLSE